MEAIPECYLDTHSSSTSTSSLCLRAEAVHVLALSVDPDGLCLQIRILLTLPARCIFSPGCWCRSPSGVGIRTDRCRSRVILAGERSRCADRSASGLDPSVRTYDPINRTATYTGTSACPQRRLKHSRTIKQTANASAETILNLFTQQAHASHTAIIFMYKMGNKILLFYVYVRHTAC